MNDSHDRKNDRQEIGALLSRWKQMDASAGSVSMPGEDVARLVGFVEKALAAAERANELLVNAYSLPGDEGGIRFLSQDAVKLQWALKEIGIGDDSEKPSFTV
jgi:hypothetical protein